MILSVNSSARFSRFPSVITILFRDGKFLLQILCDLTNIFYEGLVYYIGMTWIFMSIHDPLTPVHFNSDDVYAIFHPCSKLHIVTWDSL